MDVKFGPNSTDEPDLLYKLQRKFKVFNTGDPLPNRGYNLVSSASKYGIVFIASPNAILSVYYLKQLIDNEKEPQHLPVQLLEKPTHIAVSCDQELLAITGGQLLCVYKVTDFFNQNVSPSVSIKCEVNPSTFVSALQWNPCIPDNIAIAFYDGTLLVSQVASGQIKKVQSKARCICWSPKGKQLVTGNSDGTLCQFKPDLTLAKTYPAPNLFEGSPVETLAIYWISTFQFAVVYKNATNNSRPAVTIVNTPKAGQPFCLSYEDICYSMSSNRPWYYYLQGLAPWNIILASSSNSMEIATLGSEDGATWLQWYQADEARPELPLTDKKQENYPVGITIDTCAIHQLPWGENETLPFMPLLLVVSQSGLLTVFNIVNLKKDAVQLCTPPQQLTLPAAGMTSDIPGGVPQPSQQPPTPAFSHLLVQPKAEPVPVMEQQAPPPYTPVPQIDGIVPIAATKPFGSQPQAFVPAAALPVIERKQDIVPAVLSQHQVPAAQTVKHTETMPKSQPPQAPEVNAALKAEQERVNRLKADQELRSMLVKEVNDFQMELYQFVVKTRDVQAKLQTDLNSIDPTIGQQSLDIERLKKECSLEELRSAIVQLKLEMVRAYAAVAEARTHAETKEQHEWTQADPLTMKRVASVKKLAYYVQTQLDQAHKALDYKWNEMNRDTQFTKPGQRMIRPILDDVYQPLVKQQEILSRQQAVLRTLKNMFKECDTTPVFKSSSLLRSTPFKNKDPLSKLTKNILNMSIEPEVKQQDTLLTPQKLDALRDMLSNHRPIKIKPVNVELRQHLATMRLNYEKSVKEKAALAFEQDTRKVEVVVKTEDPIIIPRVEHRDPVEEAVISQTKPKPIPPQMQPKPVPPQMQPKPVPPQMQPNPVPPQMQPNPVPPQMQPAPVPPQIQEKRQPQPQIVIHPQMQMQQSQIVIQPQIQMQQQKPEIQVQMPAPSQTQPQIHIIPGPIKSQQQLGSTAPTSITVTSTTLSVLKDMLQNKMTNVETKSDANTFMGQKICTPTAFTSTPVTKVQTPANNFSSKPISDINNMFSKFTSQPFGEPSNKPIAIATKSKSSDETGEPDTAEANKHIASKTTEERPITNLFGIKTSSPIAATQQIVPDVVKSNAFTIVKPDAKVTVKLIEEEPQKSKENIADIPSASASHFTQKPVMDEKKKIESNLFGTSMNKTSVSESVVSVTTTVSSTNLNEPVKPLDTKTENIVSIKAESSTAPSPSSIFAAANATTATASAPKSIFGTPASPTTTSPPGSLFATTKTTPPVKNLPDLTTIKDSTPITSTAPSASFIFGTAAASHPIQFGKASESGSLFTPTATTISSVFSSSPQGSIFGSPPSTPTSSPASPVFETNTEQAGFTSTAETKPTVFSTPTPSSPLAFAPTASTAFGSNPSAVFASATTPTSVFGSANTSVFGSPATTAQSIFGATTPVSEPTSSNTTASTTQSIFGANSTPQSNSVFGSTTTTTQSVFGGAIATTQASIFGSPTTTQSSTFGPTATTQSSAFGGTTQTSVFGTGTSLTQSSIFGSPNQTTQASVFGSPTQTTQSVFGTPSATTASSASSLFGGAEANLFASASISTSNSSSPTSGGSIFGGGSASPVFGGGGDTNVFGAKTAFNQSNATAASIFGGGGATSFGQKPTANFWSNANANAGTGFGSTGFGQSPTTQSTSVFGGGTASGGSFSSPSTGQPFSNPQQSSVFGTPQQQTSSAFGGSPVFGNKPVFPQQSGFGSPTPSGGAFGSSFGGFNKSPGGGFGAAATFGGGATFGGSAFGNTSPGKMFGSPQTPTSFGNPTQSNSTFENLATQQNTLSFGNLAQQSGPSPQQAPSFNTSPSFTGWRG